LKSFKLAWYVVVFLLDDETQAKQEQVEDAQVPHSLQNEGQLLLGIEINRQAAESDSQTEQQDSCVWNSSEMQVLRRTFKAKSDENAALRSQVCVLQDDVEKMTAERQTLRTSLENSRQRLHTAQTANTRLQMLVNHLNTELQRTTKELDRLRSVEAERDELDSQLQKMQLELSSADLQHDRDVASREDTWTKVLEEQRLEDTEVKTQLSRDVVRLEHVVEQLEQQLSDEKEDHSRTRRGLEHLRVHFMTMSMPGEQLSHVHTHSDELVNWTY